MTHDEFRAEVRSRERLLTPLDFDIGLVMLWRWLSLKFKVKP